MVELPKKGIDMENGCEWCIDVDTQDPPIHKSAIPKIQLVHFPMSEMVETAQQQSAMIKISGPESTIDFAHCLRGLPARF